MCFFDIEQIEPVLLSYSRGIRLPYHTEVPYRLADMCWLGTMLVLPIFTLLFSYFLAFCIYSSNSSTI